ncbi:putative E3 ubiquitin-protein ligase RING1a [Lotus japonicus]|uniref:putative E3 ubiquitin-protein ligase RING1a n=1 Tax=Lotus japonicus TaxID=34305 RepID=UPI0025850B3B|nr:putative E3 ubiquitin-protein ligase RING1a [Lotus japonicus]
METEKRSHDAPHEEDADADADALTMIMDNYNGGSEPESDGSNSSSSEEEPEDEYMLLDLSDLHQQFQCAICLGIIRKTRTVMECLHRFCKDCIDKSMRLGNNECPTCRTHCPSRRSLRDDPNFDALIAAVYPDLEEYEQEELALHEDEMTHNKKIQASIAQTLKRQTEALGKKRKRSRRNSRNADDLPESNDNENMNDSDVGKDSSSVDERTETEPRTCNTFGEQESQFPQNSASTDPDGAGGENIQEVSIEISASSTPAWGTNAPQSHPRVGGKSPRSSRLASLVDHLGNSSGNNDEEVSVFLKLDSLDEQTVPSLEKPYLVCKNPSMSVKMLCEHVALKTGLQVDEVELWLVSQPENSILEGERTADAAKDNLRLLGDEEILAELISSGADVTVCGHLVIAYRRKSLNPSVDSP